MKDEILLNKLFRLPLNTCLKLYNKFMDETKVDATTFAMHQRVADLVGEKISLRERIREDVLDKARMYLAFMLRRDSIFSSVAYEEMKKFPIIIWTELIGDLNQTEITAILNGYAHDMPAVLIECFIMNLPEDKQAKAIEKYKHRLDSKNEYFSSFYYCVGEEAKSKLKAIFKNNIEEDSILHIEDLTEENLLNGLQTYKERLNSTEMDDIVEQILLKTKNPEIIFSAIEIFGDRIQEISDMRFKTLVRRTANLLGADYTIPKEVSLFDDDVPSELDKSSCIELEIFERFKNRFYTLGIVETLEILNIQVNSYDDNEIGNEIIFSFLDIAYEDESLNNYINNKTLCALTKRFKEKCQRITYTLEDFEKLVLKIRTESPQKLIRDDYIEAMIACGQLMKKNLINDQNPLFIKLRNSFITMLNNSVKKDGTYNEDINLNGIFYRLIKGSLDFEKIITTKTYKGLIYLTKCGDCINQSDEITQYLSDEQVAKIDIKPLLRWRKELLQKEAKNQAQEHNENIDSKTAFLERMGLQLLCYFGELRAKHILDFDVAKNRMENLFDNIDYKQIEIDEFGKPIVNEELMEFLFGRGSVSEKNTIINKILWVNYWTLVEFYEKYVIILNF